MEELDLVDLWRIVWSGRWWVGILTMLSGCIGIAYILLATEWYRAEVLLIPTDSKMNQGLASQLSQLGGLVGLAGMTLGTGDKGEPVAVLRSKTFARRFIESQNLMPVLLASDWDASRNNWKVGSGIPPDIRDAVEYFDRNVRRVTEDRKTGLVSLTIDWKDPKQAAEWANLLAKRLNDDIRQRALADATDNIEYLQSQLNATTVVSLQQATARLLEGEMQKVMVARGNEEYAFRVIDSAQVPTKPVRPKRLIVLMSSILLGLMVGIAVVLLRHAFVAHDARETSPT